ncbi:response regulator [Luteibacter aegosomatissinici]|uniref:response regulator n=1 Tax=Luteibacter aegosomatissinici TaxID=2911539 RepID=UPI003CCD4571
MSDADNAGSMIRVLITDDHPVMRHGLRAAISTQADMALAGEAANGREAIEKFRELRPSVALMDLQMPDVDGLDAISAIRSEFPDANIIVLTSYPGDARIMRALMLGATSYLLKSSSLEEIVRAIRASMAGRHVMDPDVAHDLAAYAGTELLTAKEVAVLALVAQGHGNKMIAGELFVSEETVKSRMRSILSKLNARDRTHAVMLAIQRGFLQP